MEPELTQTIALLTRTPAVLDALLRDLPDAWTLQDEGENTWTARDVVAHLVFTERVDWIPRAKMIVEFGEKQTFQPLDREASVQENGDKRLAELLDEFARVRGENLRELRSWNLSAEDLARRGRHPAFGSVTLGQLLATWGAHDLTHLHQISRIMAHQYREAVGPWSAYLGVLKCTGHSEAS